MSAETARAGRDADIIDLYHRAWHHTNTTIESTDLDGIGHVPWWPPDRSEVTLHLVLIHMIAETNRHAGHADVVRELIDGATGLRAGQRQHGAPATRLISAYRARLEDTARRFEHGDR